MLAELFVLPTHSLDFFFALSLFVFGFVVPSIILSISSSLSSFQEPIVNTRKLLQYLTIYLNIFESIIINLFDFAYKNDIAFAELDRRCPVKLSTA